MTETEMTETQAEPTETPLSDTAPGETGMSDPDASDSELDWYGPETATFGDRVAAAREAARMTQAQLARRLGVKKSTLAGWEQDLAEPRANKLSMMSGLLGVSMSWLLTGEGDDLPAPADADEIHSDLAAVARELRGLREDLRQQTERAGRLEKMVRKLMVSQESSE